MYIAVAINFFISILIPILFSQLVKLKRQEIRKIFILAFFLISIFYLLSLSDVLNFVKLSDSNDIISLPILWGQSSLVFQIIIAIGILLILLNDKLLENDKMLLVFLLLFSERILFFRYSIPLQSDIIRMFLIIALVIYLVFTLKIRFFIFSIFVLNSLFAYSSTSNVSLPQFSHYEIEVYNYLRTINSNHTRVVDATQSKNFTPNKNLNFKVPNIGGYFPINSKNTSDYIFYLLTKRSIDYTTPVAFSGFEDSNQKINLSDFELNKRFYDLASVRFIITDKSDNRQNSNSLRTIWSNEKFKIAENIDYFPSSWLVCDIIPIEDSSEILKIMTDTTLDFRNQIIVDSRQNFTFSADCKDNIVPTFNQLNANTIKISFDKPVNKSSFLVISQNMNEGWRVQGLTQNPKLYSVNLVQMGFVLPADENIDSLYLIYSEPNIFNQTTQIGFLSVLLFFLLTFAKKLSRDKQYE